jgi:ATP-dependent DNA ligase
MFIHWAFFVIMTPLFNEALMTNQYPDVLSILEAVSAVPGKNDKLAILEANKTNPDLKQAFFLALNGLISFYIKKLPTATEYRGEETLASAMAALVNLSARVYTGHAAAAFVQNLLESLTERDAEVLRRVLGRDLRIGAGDGSADKVWPGLVPRFAVMLATSFSDKALKKIKYPAYAQLKADGSRTQVIVDLDKQTVTFWTRKGNEVFLSKETADKMLALFADGSWEGTWVVDGEIISIDANGVVDRATGNGIYNKAVKGSISPEEEAQLHFQVWDLIPYDAWQAGFDNQFYSERLRFLKELNHDTFTSVIETTVVNNLQEAEAVYQKYIEQDLEGIILKNLDGPWEDARSKNQVKFKQVMTADLEILEVIAGKEGKKYEDVAGTLRCSTSCRQLFVDASGMSDDERKWFWENRHTIGGSIAEIEYNGIVKRRGATIYSLFLPQFVVLRPDKTVANSLDELQTKKSIASVK